MTSRTAFIIRCVTVFSATAAACQAQPARHEPDLAAKSSAARQAVLTGHYAEAATLYREMVALVPEGTPEKNGLRTNLALALENSGHPAEAVPVLERVVRAQPESGPAWFLLGLAYQQLSQPLKAIAPLQRAVRLQPENAEAWLELGDAQLASGRPREAVNTFEVLTGRHPEIAKGWQGLGLSYVALGERAFSALLETAPESPLATALVSHARKHEETAGIEEPDWYKAGDWKTGLASAEKSASAANLYWASRACEQLATQQFARLEQMPRTPEMHELLAQSYSRLGRRSDAVREWRTALELRPGDHRLQGRLAEALIRDRRFEEARKLIEPLAAAEGQNAEFQYLLGDVLLEQKEEALALKYLRRAEELLPESLPAQEALGRTYLALGNPKQAVPHLEKARPLDDGSISFALSSAYKRLGREEDSRAALARYKLLTGEPR